MLATTPFLGISPQQSREIHAAVDFYATPFSTPPAKRRPGYANLAVENPQLKLGETINAHALTVMFKYIVANNRVGRRLAKVEARN